MDGAPSPIVPGPAPARAPGTAPGRAPGVIGPNSVVQLGEAMTALEGPEAARALFGRVGHGALLESPPAAMIDERVPAALFACLWRDWPEDVARAVSAEAGRLTGDYILAHRIPAPARAVLRGLPAGIGADLLLAAIRRHAWTFAGSGGCATARRPRRLMSVTDNPLAMPDCVWHRAVLGRLFARLVSPRLRVTHTACCRTGAPACRFEITTAEERPRGWTTG